MGRTHSGNARLIVFDLSGYECMMDVGGWGLARGEGRRVGWERKH